MLAEMMHEARFTDAEESEENKARHGNTEHGREQGETNIIRRRIKERYSV